MKRIVLYGVAPLLSAIALCAVWIRLSVFFPGTLPPPRGPHAVGRTEFDWQDELGQILLSRPRGASLMFSSGIRRNAPARCPPSMCAKTGYEFSSRALFRNHDE